MAGEVTCDQQRGGILPRGGLGGAARGSRFGSRARSSSTVRVITVTSGGSLGRRPRQQLGAARDAAHLRLAAQFRRDAVGGHRRPRRAQGHSDDRNGLPEGDCPRAAARRRSNGPAIQPRDPPPWLGNSTRGQHDRPAQTGQHSPRPARRVLGPAEPGRWARPSQQGPATRPHRTFVPDTPADRRATLTRKALTGCGCTARTAMCRGGGIR
jgi:hypothetical protein